MNHQQQSLYPSTTSSCSMLLRMQFLSSLLLLLSTATTIADYQSKGDEHLLSKHLHPPLKDFPTLEVFSVHLLGHTVYSGGPNGTLQKTRVSSSDGQDVHGHFVESIYDWDAPSWPKHKHGTVTYFQTSVKVYDNFKYENHDSVSILKKLQNQDHLGEPSTMAYVYTQRYPQGVPDESDCLGYRSGHEGSRENVVDGFHDTGEDDDYSPKDGKSNNLLKDSPSPLRSNFPSLNVGNLHYFSFGGGFLQEFSKGNFPSKEMGLKDGVEAGPILLFEHRQGENSPTWCGIISHFNEFMTQTMQHTPGTSIIGHGPMDSICPLPAGYEAKTILIVNNRPSIYAAAQQWGKMMLNQHMGGGNRRIHDVDYTTRYLGYSTDNGAYYYYHKEEDNPVTSNMEETMIALYNYSRHAMIPYRYWLLDSWWYYKSSDSKHAGVKNWTARPDIFPHGMKYLFDKTHMFVQAHNRMWAVDNVYQHEYNFINSTSPPTVAVPTEYRFWKDLFQNATDWGLVVYEQDWLNVQFEQQSQSYTNATLMRLWLTQMGKAAQDCHLAIQYCMPLARHALQSVEFPAVTQIRASGDYAAGKWPSQWNIGPTSLIHYALDLRPSKDSTWTVSEQPNNIYNSTEPYPEFQALIMAMSTGPVAFSDKIGYSNAPLILRTCREDGVLLQPAQPLIPIHEWFYQQTLNHPTIKGHILESKMVVNGLIPSTVILALELEEDFDLFPHHLSETYYNVPIVYDASLKIVKEEYWDMSPLTLHASTTGTPKDYQLYFVAPDSLGWCLLGERHKFVPLSSSRFINVEITLLFMRILLEGNDGEHVEIVYAVYMEETGWTLYNKSVQIPSSGRLSVILERPFRTVSSKAS